MTFQVYKGSGYQPLHLDSAVGWYPDGRGGMWAPLSCVLSINDGVGTYLSGAPVYGLFDKFIEKKSTPDQIRKVIDKLLSSHEKDFDVAKAPLNRAGQILTFHSGEQVHCGLSTDYKCGVIEWLCTLYGSRHCSYP